MIDFDLTDDDAALVTAIVQRYTGLAVLANPLEHIMDLTACHNNGCPLDLKGLLESKDMDLFHDICGINGNLNRETGELENCFLPRYALKEANDGAS